MLTKHAMLATRNSKHWIRDKKLNLNSLISANAISAQQFSNSGMHSILTWKLFYIVFLNTRTYDWTEPILPSTYPLSDWCNMQCINVPFAAASCHVMSSREAVSQSATTASHESCWWLVGSSILKINQKSLAHGFRWHRVFLKVSTADCSYGIKSVLRWHLANEIKPSILCASQHWMARQYKETV
jgi:hypothetical protein